MEICQRTRSSETIYENFHFMLFIKIVVQEQFNLQILSSARSPPPPRCQPTSLANIISRAAGTNFPSFAPFKWSHNAFYFIYYKEDAGRKCSL